MELQTLLNNNLIVNKNYPITPPYNYSYDYQISNYPLFTKTLPDFVDNHNTQLYPYFHEEQRYLCLPTPPLTPPKEDTKTILEVDNYNSPNIEPATTTLAIRTKSVIMKINNDQIITEIKTKSLPEYFQEEYICRWIDCWRSFESLESLASHVTQVHAIATNEGLYYCKWEDCLRSERGFNARYKMLVHVRTHTKEKPHQCQLCFKSFSRAENLKIHLRSHSGEKPYACPFEGCNKAYSNSSDRFKHTRTHSTQKPYVCKVPGCQKRYTDPSSLRKHVKTFKHTPNLSEEKQIKSNENKISPSPPTSTPFMMEEDKVQLPKDLADSSMEYSLYKDSMYEMKSECSCTDSCYDSIRNRALYTFDSNNYSYSQPTELAARVQNSQEYWTPAQYSNEVVLRSNNFNSFAPMELDTPLDLRVHHR